MNSEDLEIVKTVDEWDEREHETRREADRLRHSRWRNLAMLLLWVGSMVVAAKMVLPMMWEHKAAQERAKADRHEAQEQAWMACVNAIGTEKCNLIEERLAERCLFQDRSRMQCLEAEIGP